MGHVLRLLILQKHVFQQTRATKKTYQGQGLQCLCLPVFLDQCVEDIGYKRVREKSAVGVFRPFRLMLASLTSNLQVSAAPVLTNYLALNLFVPTFF